VTTCDSERFGKGFKLMRRGRECLAEDTLERLFYVYFNHSLCLPVEYEALYKVPKLCQEDLVSPKPNSGSGKPSTRIFMKWTGAGWCMGTCTHFYEKGVKIDGRNMRGNVAIRWVGDNGRLRDSKLSLDDYFLPENVFNAHHEAKSKPAGTWVLLRRK
jgi:hypothetical protein